MKAKELFEEIIKGGRACSITCDTLKAGDPNKELKKVAVTMFATVDTVKKAQKWGADMIIVHEPTYYDHLEEIEDLPVVVEKRKLIESTGITIYRYHDYMHDRKGKIEKTPYSASYLFTADEPITALELAVKMENELNIKRVRIAGTRNKKANKIALCFGTPGGVFELLTDENIEMVLTGEACEWKLAEYARDANALGKNKALILMGHIGSERDGMRLLAKRLSENYKEFETRYIECGEVYTYTDE